MTILTSIIWLRVIVLNWLGHNSCILTISIYLHNYTRNCAWWIRLKGHLIQDFVSHRCIKEACKHHQLTPFIWIASITNHVLLSHFYEMLDKSWTNTSWPQDTFLNITHSSAIGLSKEGIKVLERLRQNFCQPDCSILESWGYGLLK